MRFSRRVGVMWHVVPWRPNINANLVIYSHICPQQPAWGQSREFEITTRSVSRTSITQSTTGDLEDEELEDDDDELIHGRRKRKVAFMPSPGEKLM